jgi:hypothetical protein
VLGLFLLVCTLLAQHKSRHAMCLGTNRALQATIASICTACFLLPHGCRTDNTAHVTHTHISIKLHLQMHLRRRMPSGKGPTKNSLWNFLRDGLCRGVGQRHSPLLLHSCLALHCCTMSHQFRCGAHKRMHNIHHTARASCTMKYAAVVELDVRYCTGCSSSHCKAAAATAYMALKPVLIALQTAVV